MSIQFAEAKSTIPPGRYRHFKGNAYEVIGIARRSETEGPMVVYKALYDLPESANKDRKEGISCGRCF